jgi:hypothetical protein
MQEISPPPNRAVFVALPPKQNYLLYIQTIATLCLIEHSRPGLPDFTPKIPIWVYFGGLGMENVGIFYDRLEYYTAI